MHTANCVAKGKTGRTNAAAKKAKADDTLLVRRQDNLWLMSWKPPNWKQGGPTICFKLSKQYDSSS